MTSSPWIATPQRRSGCRVRLFCFPFAGGSASAYWDWPALLPREIEVCAIQLPGRGARYSEPALSSMHDVVDALARGLAEWFDRPFAFYGHSMGALLAFELAHDLRIRGKTMPLALFPAAHQAPSIAHHFGIDRRGDDDVIEYIKRTSDQPELLDHPELLKLVLPTLRADLSVCDSYEYRTRPELACPITVFGGLDDVISRGELAAWQSETSGECQVEMLKGGHFFLNASREALLQTILDHLAPVIRVDKSC